MQINHESPSTERLRLGLAERWIIAAVTFSLITIFGWTVTFVASLSRAQNDMSTQLAVANAQLAAIRQQLASVPQNTQSLAELKIQVGRNTQDIHEIQAYLTGGKK
jgi:hypothetical protein